MTRSPVLDTGNVSSNTRDVRSARGTRTLAMLLLLLAVAGATGCDRILEALDGLRRSTGEQWDRGRRRTGG